MLSKATKDIDVSDLIDPKVLIAHAKQGDVKAFDQLKKIWATLPAAEYPKKLLLSVESAFIAIRVALLSGELIAKYSRGSMQRDFSHLKKHDNGDDSQFQRPSYENDGVKLEELKQYAVAGNSNAQYAYAMVYKESNPELYKEYIQLAVLNHNTNAKFEMACAMNENINGFNYNKLTVIRLLTDVMIEDDLLIGSVYDYVSKFCKPEIKKLFYLHCLQKGLKDGFRMQDHEKGLDMTDTIFKDVIIKMTEDVRLSGYVLSPKKTSVFSEISKLLKDFSLLVLIRKASDSAFQAEDDRFTSVLQVLNTAKSAKGNTFMTASVFGGHNRSDVKMYNLLVNSLTSATLDPQATHVADIAEAKHSAPVPLCKDLALVRELLNQFPDSEDEDADADKMDQNFTHDESTVDNGTQGPN